MYPIILSNPAEHKAFVKFVIKETIEELKDPAPDHITLKEAMGVLNIGYTPLRRRIQKAGVRTYSHGKEKAFDRKFLYKLRS